MLVKCSELLMVCLGYSKCSQASWYLKMINNPDLVVKQNGTRFFTIRGLNFAI